MQYKHRKTTFVGKAHRRPTNDGRLGRCDDKSDEAKSGHGVLKASKTARSKKKVKLGGFVVSVKRTHMLI